MNSTNKGSDRPSPGVAKTSSFYSMQGWFDWATDHGVPGSDQVVNFSGGRVYRRS